MPRLLFEKIGNAVWISHLDLMRLFQRAFKRAGLSLKHTQGFNPRPSVSIALPLSVGIESRCELLDFELEGDIPSLSEIPEKLNAVLVEGVRVLGIIDGGRKIRDLAFLDCTVILEYDCGVPENACLQIQDLFACPEVIVTKKTKNGMQDQNIISMIRRLSVSCESEKTIRIDALVCCQNPTLNPNQLVLAIEKYLPDVKPDFSRICRNEVFTMDEVIFR